MQSVDAVYDRGSALNFDADYADYAALVAGSPASGEYGTSLADGLIGLGATPAGIVTADVKGSDTGAVYVTTTADISERIATAQGGLTAADLNDASFGGLNTANSSTVGIYIDQPRTVAEVLDDLVSGVGGFYGFSRLGKMFVGRFEAATGGFVAEFDSSDIIDIERVALPDSVEPANWRRRVGYQHNWTQQRDDVAAAVTAARRAFLAEEFRVVIASDSSVKTKHLLATDPPMVRGSYAAKADAQTEATRLLTLFKADPAYYRVRLKTQPFAFDSNDKIKIKFPRWGLDGGRRGRVVALEEDGLRNEVTATVFIA